MLILNLNMFEIDQFNNSKNFKTLCENYYTINFNNELMNNYLLLLKLFETLFN